MSVIIRLQNLPWSANAMDIRKFFRGLSIPEGGVHIVGGELGIAFIAFSTDEDARQAMMHDNESIKEVKVRLLLSSRAEMQKVIDQARINSISVMQQFAAAAKTPSTRSAITHPNVFPINSHSSRTAASMLSPNGPTAAFLAYQQEAGITLTGSPISSSNEFTIMDNKALMTGEDSSNFKSNSSYDRRSHERERELRQSNSIEGRDFRRRHDESRSRSRERSQERDLDRDLVNKRLRGLNQNRGKSTHRSEGRGRDPRLWRDATSSTLSNYNVKRELIDEPKATTTKESKPTADSPQTIIPFQNYTTTSISNNYSIGTHGGNSNSKSSGDATALEFNPKIMLTKTVQQQLSTASNIVEVNSVNNRTSNTLSTTLNRVATQNSLPVAVDQGSIAFAKTNPYEQMYPTLFAQAAPQQMSRSNSTTSQRMNLPSGSDNDTKVYSDSCSIKISDMCTNTNYSDLRKFFYGLFIPHNGIKMINDKHGQRTGVAYIQFSRSNSVHKALARNHTILRSNAIKIEAVSDEEFNEAEEGVIRFNGRFECPNDNDADDRQRSHFESGNMTNSSRNDSSSHSQMRNCNNEPFSVLYLEELPSFTAEQDIMKMFSSYSLYDILLMPSAENRREFVAYVKFSMADDAKSALEDNSTHMIGYRKVRVYPGSEEDMERAKEKLRLANEQLLKEENAEEVTRAAAAELEEEAEVIENAENEKARETHSILRHFEKSSSANPGLNKKNNSNSVRNMTPSDPRFCVRSQQSRFDPNESNDNQTPPGIDLSINNTSNAMNDYMRNNTTWAASANPFNSIIDYGDQSGSNNGNFNYEMPHQRQMNTCSNFLHFYNCPYSTGHMDIAGLFQSRKIMVKHIEMLYNEKGQPSGEFFVEVFNARDAEKANKECCNIQFRGRNLRVRSTTPQAIADRLKMPFMNCIPGGSGPGGPGQTNLNFNNNPDLGMMNMTNNGTDKNFIRGNSPFGRGRYGSSNDTKRQHSQQQSGGRRSRSNNNYDIDDKCDESLDAKSNWDNDNNSDAINVVSSNSHGNGGGGSGLPEKFTRPNCVVALANVPYKADLKDILRFFAGFNVRVDDIIRRFNDDGTATSDARVAFSSPAEAQAACLKFNRQQIFNRTIFLSIL